MGCKYGEYGGYLAYLGNGRPPELANVDDNDRLKGLKCPRCGNGPLAVKTMFSRALEGREIEVTHDVCSVCGWMEEDGWVEIPKELLKRWRKKDGTLDEAKLLLEIKTFLRLDPT